MDIILDFNQIVDIAHTNAKNKGFWEIELQQQQRRNDGEMLALIHSEIAELYDALITANPSQKIPDFTEAEEEFADIIIRIADLVGGRAWPVANYLTEDNNYFINMQNKINALFPLQDYVRYNIIANFLHSGVGQVTEAIRQPQPNLAAICIPLAGMIKGIDYFAQTFHYRVVEAIELKINYNSNRPYKHGKNF